MNVTVAERAQELDEHLLRFRIVLDEESDVSIEHGSYLAPVRGSASNQLRGEG
jgi:hypothetical protein